MAAITITGLSKIFGGLRAVDGIDLHIGSGEILGLIGPNGAGKTTFVNLLTGDLRPSSGKVEFNGRDITDWPPHRRCAVGVARTFQVPRPFADLTIRENVMIGGLFGSTSRHTSLSDAREQAEEILESLGMAQLGDRASSSLSTAGLKRLEIARCLAVNPKLLMLDEPLGGLNPTEANEAQELIRRINQRGVTILFIEHIIPAVMSLSHRVVVLANGRKLAEGLPSEIQENLEVQRAYLGDVHGAVDRFATRRRKVPA
ncbi:ABC transporter ATP-binding protein [Roseomonas chloroacetimidivorans]|uniref:ABC transporter ATP-binding protein n=1 Tax=Roseomonas chloroacetimidivorans TaxID=1766656 RepID=UPI003C70A8DD